MPDDQSLTSSLQLGGEMAYVPGRGKVTTAVGGVYDDQTNLLAFLWNQDVSTFSLQTFSLVFFSICFLLGFVSL